MSMVPGDKLKSSCPWCDGDMVWEAIIHWDERGADNPDIVAVCDNCEIAYEPAELSRVLMREGKLIEEKEVYFEKPTTNA